MVESYVNSEVASSAGVGYTRILLRWDVIQPTGPADWRPANFPDPSLAADLAAGRQVVAILIGTPAWASAQGGASSKDVPDMHHWANFVRRMAQQYRGRIQHWIIWNEPDVWIADHPGSTWNGTVAEYALLLQTAHRAIREVDPTLQVHLAGLTYYWDWAYGRQRYLDRLLEALAADPEAAQHGFYFDAVVYHVYFNPWQTVDVLAETRRTLAAHGLADKEIWINETNAPPSHDAQELPWSPPRFHVSLSEQAAFILQQFALAFSSGAERVQVYKLRNTADHPESIEPFGLLRADDSHRPALAAYRTATTYLGGFRSARRERSGDVVAVTFDRGAQTSTVLWVTGAASRQVHVRALTAQALLVDSQGNSRTITAREGVYTIDLPGAECNQGPPCMIGGAPRLLIESAVAASRSALLAAAVLPTPAPCSAPCSDADASGRLRYPGRARYLHLR